MSSSTLLLPRLGVGVVVLSNTYPGVQNVAVAEQILEAYTRDEARDWIAIYADLSAERRARATEAIAAEQPTEAEKGSPSLPLDAYVGTTYTDAWRGDVSVELRDGQLFMDFSRTDSLHGPLEHHRNDVFIVRWQDTDWEFDAYAHFRLGFDGQVESIEMKAVSPLTDPSFDFHDLDLTRADPPESGD